MSLVGVTDTLLLTWVRDLFLGASKDSTLLVASDFARLLTEYAKR